MPALTEAVQPTWTPEELEDRIERMMAAFHYSRAVAERVVRWEFAGAQKKQGAMAYRRSGISGPNP
jgi:hypothetical protein